MNSIILTGETVTLRNITPDDLHTLWAFIYGDEFPEWKKWDAPYFPLKFQTYEQFSEHMTNFLQAEERVPCRFIIETDGKIVGTVSYYWEHKESSWLEVGIVIYDPLYWNGGYGTEALRLWIDYLLSSLPLVRIGLTTWSGNPRMVRCAEKLGMKMEACIRKCRLYNGNYYDSIRMGMLREERTNN